VYTVDTYCFSSFTCTVLPDVLSDYESINEDTPPHYECIDDEAHYESITGDVSSNSNYEDIDYFPYRNSNSDPIYSTIHM